MVRVRRTPRLRPLISNRKIIHWISFFCFLTWTWTWIFTSYQYYYIHSIHYPSMKSLECNNFNMRSVTSDFSVMSQITIDRQLSQAKSRFFVVFCKFMVEWSQWISTRPWSQPWELGVVGTVCLWPLLSLLQCGLWLFMTSFEFSSRLLKTVE